MPSTFVRIVPAGSSQDRRTLDWPARWMIRSGRTSSTTAAAAAGSLRSASRIRAPAAACHDTPPWGRTTPKISTPGSSACRKSTRCPPTKPPAPVTRSLTGSPRAPGGPSSPPP